MRNTSGNLPTGEDGRIAAAREAPSDTTRLARIELKLGLPMDRRQRLPKVYRHRDHDEITADFCGGDASAPTITSSIWRRIPVATAAWAAVVCPLNPQSYRCVRRRNLWTDAVSVWKPRGYQRNTRFSAGKRHAFPALRSTGILPVFWT
jgi:hypothetical protein